MQTDSLTRPKEQAHQVYFPTSERLGCWTDTYLIYTLITSSKDLTCIQILFTRQSRALKSTKLSFPVSFLLLAELSISAHQMAQFDKCANHTFSCNSI